MIMVVMVLTLIRIRRLMYSNVTQNISNTNIMSEEEIQQLLIEWNGMLLNVNDIT